MIFFSTIDIYIIVFTEKFNRSEHITIERFKIVPNEAQNIEIILSTDVQLPDKEFVRHLLTHVSNKYEGQIINPSDLLSFEFYGRSLSLQVFKIHTFPCVRLDEQLQNININDDERYYHISSSTTWSIKNDFNEDNVNYPISSVGGLSDIYEKVINIVQKSKYQSKHSID